jgi:hypothetical protein
VGVANQPYCCIGALEKSGMAEEILFVLCDHLPAYIGVLVLSSATNQYRASANRFADAATLLAT